jgi:hypothetical protein
VNTFKTTYWHTYAGVGTCLIALFFVGYLRDYVFVNINYELIDIYYHRNDWQMPSVLSYFENWDYARLYYFKYALTGLFVVLYLGISMLCVRLLFVKNRYLVYTLAAYSVVITTALMLNKISLLGIDDRQAYLFSRELMGFVQSPFLFIVLLCVFFLAEKKSVFTTEVKR